MTQIFLLDKMRVAYESKQLSMSTNNIRDVESVGQIDMLNFEITTGGTVLECDQTEALS